MEILFDSLSAWRNLLGDHTLFVLGAMLLAGYAAGAFHKGTMRMM